LQVDIIDYYENKYNNSFIQISQIAWDVCENVSVGVLFSQSFGDKDTEYGIQNIAVYYEVRANFNG